MRHTTGSSLIEILISLFILSLMLLTFDAVQLEALQKQKSTYYFTMATNQLAEIRERLKNVKDGDYIEQLAIWNQHNESVLPKGHGEISEDGSKRTITIFWGDIGDQCGKNTIGEAGCLIEEN